MVRKQKNFSKPKRKFNMQRRMWRGRGKQPMVHSFKRVVYLPGFITTGIGAAGGGARAFQLSDLSNVTDFTNLFDQYAITGVKISLVPNFSQANVASGVAPPALGMLHTVLDYDSDNTPGSLTTLLEYDNYKSTRMHQIHSRWIRPRVAQAMYSTVATTGYGPGRGTQWIDCSYVNVPHYALRYWVDATPGGVIEFALKMVYYFKCKHTI